MMQPDTHERWSQLLPLYVNGRLEGAQREQLTRHLAECARCRAELAGWREIQRLVRQPQPGEAHLQPAQASLAKLHQRIASSDAAPAKEVHMQPSIPPTTPSSSHPERRSMFPAVAIVALLAVFVVTGFAVFRAQRPGTPNVAATKTKTPTATVDTASPCGSTLVSVGNGGTFQATTGQSVTVHGITVTLKNFYMDDTRTLVVMNVQSPPSHIGTAYSPMDVSLIPASGKAISDTTTGGSTQGSLAVSASLLPSLPLGQLGTQQTATLRINQMLGGSSNATLNGPWQLPVTFTTVKPHSVEKLGCVAQTHHGISIQPLSVAQAPAAKQIDGYPGGIRFGLCFVGASDADFYENYSGGIFGGFSPGGAMPPAETQPLLTLPDGQQVTPQYEDNPTPSCQIAGQTGRLYTLTYLALTEALTGKAVFTVPAFVPYVPNSSGTPVPGPWTFSFELK